MHTGNGSVQMPNLKKVIRVAVVMNNCVLVISLQDATLKYDFIGGKPLQVDHTLRIYESEGK